MQRRPARLEQTVRCGTTNSCRMRGDPKRHSGLYRSTICSQQGGHPLPDVPMAVSGLAAHVEPET